MEKKCAVNQMNTRYLVGQIDDRFYCTYLCYKLSDEILEGATYIFKQVDVD